MSCQRNAVELVVVQVRVIFKGVVGCCDSGRTCPVMELGGRFLRFWVAVAWYATYLNGCMLCDWLLQPWLCGMCGRRMIYVGELGEVAAQRCPPLRIHAISWEGVLAWAPRLETLQGEVFITSCETRAPSLYDVLAFRQCRPSLSNLCRGSRCPISACRK